MPTPGTGSATITVPLLKPTTVFVVATDDDPRTADCSTSRSSSSRHRRRRVPNNSTLTPVDLPLPERLPAVRDRLRLGGRLGAVPPDLRHHAHLLPPTGRRRSPESLTTTPTAARRRRRRRRLRVDRLRRGRAYSDPHRVRRRSCSSRSSTWSRPRVKTPEDTFRYPAARSFLAHRRWPPSTASKKTVHLDVPGRRDRVGLPRGERRRGRACSSTPNDPTATPSPGRSSSPPTPAPRPPTRREPCRLRRRPSVDDVRDAGTRSGTLPSASSSRDDPSTVTYAVARTADSDGRGHRPPVGQLHRDHRPPRLRPITDQHDPRHHPGGRRDAVHLDHGRLRIQS